MNHVYFEINLYDHIGTQKQSELLGWTRAYINVTMINHISMLIFYLIFIARNCLFFFSFFLSYRIRFAQDLSFAQFFLKFGYKTMDCHVIIPVFRKIEFVEILMK